MVTSMGAEGLQGKLELTLLSYKTNAFALLLSVDGH